MSWRLEKGKSAFDPDAIRSLIFRTHDVGPRAKAAVGRGRRVRIKSASNAPGWVSAIKSASNAPGWVSAIKSAASAGGWAPPPAPVERASSGANRFNGPDEGSLGDAASDLWNAAKNVVSNVQEKSDQVKQALTVITVLSGIAAATGLISLVRRSI